MASSRIELKDLGWRYGALLLALVGLVELAAQLWSAGRAPRLDDYLQLRDPLSSLRQEGDVLVMAPHWAEPLARRALGDALMPLTDVARPDDADVGYAIEMSILGQRDPGLERWALVEERVVGPFTMRRLRNPSPTPARFDFVSALSPPTARAALVPGAACVWSPRARLAAGGLGGHPTFPRARFVCGGSPFVHVGVTVIADQDFRARRCIWAHPPARGELRVVFDRVPLADEIIGHAGMYWMVERERRGAPVELVVSVDGSELGRTIHADGDGWARFAMPLGGHAGKAAAEVVFAVSSPDNRHRHFCFEARTR